MTQSGQGNEPWPPAAPPARPAEPPRTVHEGVVLPAHGDPWPPQNSEPQQVTPAGGQEWGQPWGPDEAAGPPPGGPAAGYAPGGGP
ncbi:hypothetical protein RKE29_20955, partial [Streptomyces sp. B1866]|nr:hypothetical protein [Streptomyces sp. B1866]